jgi:hypothetical protein
MTVSPDQHRPTLLRLFASVVLAVIAALLVITILRTAFPGALVSPETPTPAPTPTFLSPT